MNQADLKAYQIVRKLFKNDFGEPFEMTAGQIILFRSIYEKQNPRIQFECYTQYGKSDVVSMAVLLRASTFPEKWVILGGTKEKAGIIMGKLIKHIFENDYTLGKFQLDKKDSLEEIRRYKSKDHVNFKIDDTGKLGDVMILSAETTKKGQDAGDILIGHGAQNLLEDDAALIPDHIHGKALRMLGGHKNNFLLKITNTFGRNHAYRSSNDPLYLKIKIDYEQGINEGRITSDYVEEMRRNLDEIMFGILYKCQYPPANIVEEGDWIPLITEDLINEAQIRKLAANGIKRLGGDIAEGGNYNAFVIRQDNYARVKEKNLEPDLMKTADKIQEIRKEEYIQLNEIFIDAIGIGSGVVSRLHQLNTDVNGIKTGEKSKKKTKIEKIENPIEYSNIRAEINWEAKLWIEHGGALEPHADWKQGTKIRYKTDGGKAIRIMSKEMMRARGLISHMESPDVWDAFVLTFAPKILQVVNAQASKPVLPYYPEIGL
mgnify:CR=1 FL=1